MTIHDLVWKGRLIITQDGHVDLPPDRQGIHGPTDPDDRRKFIDLFNDAVPQGVLFGIIKEKIRSGEIQTREHNDVVLYDRDHEGTHWLITGNSNASYGYFYAEARIVAPPAGEAEDKATHPDVLMQRFLDGAAGRADVDMVGVLWDIFTDVRSSFRLAMEGMFVPKDAIDEIDGTVLDYLTNNYGDDE